MSGGLCPVSSYALPSSFDKQCMSDAVEKIKHKASQYVNGAERFLKSGSIGDFLGAAKAIATELKGPERQLKPWSLPYNLTPLHIACLARDDDLLKAALNDSRCLSCIDQCTVGLSEEKLAVTVGEKSMPAMNHDTALHFALFTGWNEGALTLIEQLKAAGSLDHTVNNTGNSLLNLAAGNCSLEVVKELCKNFASCDGYKDFLLHTTHNHSSILHHASSQKKPDVFHFLFNEQMLFGLNTLFTPDKGGSTPYGLIQNKNYEPASEEVTWDIVREECLQEFKKEQSLQWRCNIV